MLRRLVIEFPLPPRELSANYRGTTRGKAKTVRKYRSDCSFCAILGSKGLDAPIPTLATLSLHFYYGGTDSSCYRARDADNARYSAKALQDALVDVHILSGDSAKYLKMGETILFAKAKDHKGRACVEAILEWGSEDAGT